MAVIPTGIFRYGNHQGLPMEAGEFSLARHPVTNAQWLHFIKDSGYEPESEHPRPETYLKHWNTDKKSPPKRLLQHPVTWISFIDALYYTKWAGLEIPSEWWWEKAARGTEGHTFPWGSTLWGWGQDPFGQLGTDKTATVDAFPEIRTAFGCEQMIGNVSEFCLSVEPYEDSESQPESGLHLSTPDPKKVSEDELIALKGSCYLRSGGNLTKCSHRRRLSAGRRNSWTGLRVAWSE